MSATANILLLGGTTEASALARALAGRDLAATLSYAGRTGQPRAQPVPTRIGGFGGISGLVAYLRAEGITHLIDATHPFAAQMRAHAAAAAKETGVAHILLTRPAWTAGKGDRWEHVPDIDAAIASLAGPPRRIMLAVGRMHAERFAAQGQHHYLLRFVDPPEVPPALPHHTLVVDRGPFTVDGDTRLMREHAIDMLLCKNAGGSGAAAKLAAARRLSLPVRMIDRPVQPDVAVAHDVAQVLAWLDHAEERGV
nr:cobalt-precorrin-6A reductase [Sphingomonas formosensis]